jgi:LAS superfamily LD-carboxypeptidase LdcB
MAMRKNRKKSHRLYALLFIILISFLFISKGLYFFTTSQTERDLKHLKYSDTAIKLIIDNKLDKYLINNKIYSKTLEVALTKGLYDEDLLEDYISLPYKNYDEYISQLNSLISIGYTKDEIQNVFNSLDKDEINIIIGKNKLITNLTNYTSNENFNINNLDRYIKYKKTKTNYDYDKVISYVNMYLDYPYYEHDITITNSDDILVIVNKYYKLSNTFVPKNLVKVDKDYSYGGNTYQVVGIVKDNFDEMIKDMEKDELSILVKSAYRSYQTQVELYNEYVAKHGKDAADTFSARAGYSEHQTGLVIDVCAKKNCDYSRFDTTAEYTWMKKNSYKYGFIMRYPDNKSNITGYKNESWHYRYVGLEVAKYIYDHDLTFDEYYAMSIANKKTN